MWKHPWGYKEGFVIGAGLIITGILLQISIGPFNFSFLEFPVNAILGTLFIAFVYFFYKYSVKKPKLRWFSGMEASVTAISAFLLLVVVMGFTRQSAGIDRSGILGLLGFKNMLSAWPFVLIYIYLTIVLGLATLRRLSKFRLKRDIPFLLNHVGLFIVLVAGVLGSADMHRYQMIVEKDNTEWRVTNEYNEMVEMDMAIELHEFTIDEYPPKLMVIDNETGKTLPEKQPLAVLVEEIPMKDHMLGWDVTVEKKFEYSAPVISTDSVHFVEFHSEGAAAAVFVSATNVETGETVKGWVSSGSYLFPYHGLKLDDSNSLVMPEREPRRYASDVTVYTKDGKSIRKVIEVNKPLKVNGWKIYQISYDEHRGKWSHLSVFELVRDPWLWLVYTGIIMMLLGALGLFIVGKKS